HRCVCEVKAPGIAPQRTTRDIRADRGSADRRLRQRRWRQLMSRKILSLAGHYLLRKEGVVPLASETSKVAQACPQASAPDDGTVPIADMRAVATETALASAVDASPA